MQVAGGFDLSYCSNIHRGETWEETSSALREALPRIRALLSVDGPFAIGLRLSARAAASLEEPAAFDGFAAFLRDGRYYVPTINGFPYGAFHGQRVKEQVYLPDWRNVRRLDYTNRLARLLTLLPAANPDAERSVSTVPGAFRQDVTSTDDVALMASLMLRHAAYLRHLRDTTGVTVTLAIEPEPACYIESVDDAVAFFTQHLFDRSAVDAASRAAALPLSVDDVRHHIGICFDACHMAVEFEDPAGAVARFRDAGIRICKVQVSSALELEHQDAAALRASLTPFADDTYLHQVVERQERALSRFNDLPEALAAADADGAQARHWRVHFHVPIFLESMRGFRTTQKYLASVLALLKRDPICRCLEVETYTWDVLPAEYRTSDMCAAIARELAWARAQLES
jgi:sugar phosphate isomerase/epimerase